MSSWPRPTASPPQKRGALWAVFLYRLPRSGGTPRVPAVIEQLRALPPYEGAVVLRSVGTSGNLLCWKEDALRPRDLEGLVERVANVPAFARACADLQILSVRAVRLAATRFGPRFDEWSKAFRAFGGTWRLGAAFLSLPWPLPRRSWQFLSREFLCLDWPKSQTAIIAKREQAQSGARLRWGRRLLRPLEEVGGAVQEYPLLATARSLRTVQAILGAAEQFTGNITTADRLNT